MSQKIKIFVKEDIKNKEEKKKMGSAWDKMKFRSMGHTFGSTVKKPSRQLEMC